MAVITWDAIGDHFYETGVRHGVLYPPKQAGETTPAESSYGVGVAWNGLTAYTESPSGAEETALYADDIKYLSLRSAEEFGATIEAYTYPDAWEQCDGSESIADGVVLGQQKRKSFGLCVTTVVGNDTDGNDKGEKIHIIYGGTASPSERAYQTINDSPEAITFSWEITTTPVAVGVLDGQVEKYKPVANITIDTTKADATKVATLKGMLFGTDNTEPYLPTPKAIHDLFK